MYALLTDRFSIGLTATALSIVVAGCAAGPTATAATPYAEDTQGRYRLVFEPPRTDWHASDSITGEATLSLVGSGSADFGSSGGGPLAFGFDEVGGTRHVGPAMTSDCALNHLAAGQSLSSPIRKSGGFNGDDPNADFYRSFFADSLVHLPPGDWTITAVASLVDGVGCSGVGYTLRAPIVVHVTA